MAVVNASIRLPRRHIGIRTGTMLMMNKNHLEESLEWHCLEQILHYPQNTPAGYARGQVQEVVLMKQHVIPNLMFVSHLHRLMTSDGICNQFNS